MTYIRYSNPWLMKRIIPFIIAVFSFNSVVSQSLSLSDDSGPIPNGAVIYLHGDCGVASKIEAKIKVMNNSPSAMNINVKKYQNGVLSGSSNTLCFAGNSFGSSASVSPSSVTVGPGEMDSTFSGDYYPKGYYGTSSITYVFYDVNNAGDSVGVTVNFVALPPNVAENNNLKYEISNPLPNPARNLTIFNYKFSVNSKEVKFLVQDLLGNIVIQEPVYDLQGKLTIDVSALKSGVYFYSFLINNKSVISKKLIIQH